MKLQGSFLDINGSRVTVVIDGGTTGGTIQIGDDVKFGTDPVNIAHSYNDQFDLLMRESCSINLLSPALLSELFSKSILETPVAVTRGTETLFRGFLEPRVFSQPYNKILDSVTLNCLDILSALQFCLWENVSSAGVNYSQKKASAGRQTARAILEKAFAPVTDLPVVSDNSRKILSTDALDMVSVDTSIFFGETEEDTWTMEEVAEEILKYFNLRACIDNNRVYIYSPDRLATGSTVIIGRDNAWGRDHSIDIRETFNQLSLKVDRDIVEEAISDPLGSDSAFDVYPTRKLWCTEYAAYGWGDFLKIAGIQSPEASATVQWKGFRKDHYIKVKNAANWKFGGTSNRTDYSDDYYFDMFGTSETAPQTGVNKIQRGFGAMLLEVQTGEQKYDPEDNSIPATTDDASYLVVGVGGDGDNSASAAASFSTTLLHCSPRAVYEGQSINLSPADNDTTRYIVIGGKIRLNPIHNPKRTWSQLSDSSSISDLTLRELSEDYPDAPDDVTHHGGVSDGRFYTRSYWTGPAPDRIMTSDPYYGLSPVETDKEYESIEYNYSSAGEAFDTMLKLPVLACMLIVGDKCLVETDGSGTLNSYQWKPYKELSQCSGVDEYYAQSFSIGVDPKIGDKIIGPERDITNNLHYSSGLGESGTAIPIRKSDGVSGEIKFIILGPYNMMWNNITRRHPTWFRHTQWTEQSIPLLSHISSIWVKDFTVKIISDNGGSTTSDGDLVYSSATDESYVNKKEDLSFRICSDLTVTERTALEVNDAVCRNMAVNSNTGSGILEIQDVLREIQAKPEKLYLDWLWKKSSTPRLTLIHGMKDTGSINRWAAFQHQAISGKTFTVDGISRNLRTASVEVTMTEK